MDDLDTADITLRPMSQGMKMQVSYLRAILLLSWCKSCITLNRSDDTNWTVSKAMASVGGNGVVYLGTFPNLLAAVEW